MYRAIDIEVKLKGVLVSILRDWFGDRLPTVEEFCSSEKIAPSTIFRLKDAVLALLRQFLGGRGPGVRPSQAASLSEAETRLRVLEEVQGVAAAIGGLPEAVKPTASGHRRLGAQAKEYFLRARDRLKQTAKLTAEEFSRLVGIGSGQLRRWDRQKKKTGSLAARSQRPRVSPGQLPEPLAGELVKFRTAYPKLSITAFTKLFNDKHPEQLESAGSKRVGRKAITRVLTAAGLYKPAPDRRPSPDRRGTYTYLGKLTAAMMDTVWLKVAGVKLAVIALMDSGTRAILGCSVGLSETGASIQELIAKTRERFPTLAATIQDHGMPYRERTLREYLDELGILGIYCRRHRPQSKGALERFFLTLQTRCEEALAELERALSGVADEQKKSLLPAVVGFLLNALYLSGYHNEPQEHIDAKSPAERMAEPTPEAAPVRPTVEELAARLQGNRPKNEFLAEIAEHFGFGVSAARLGRELARFPAEALQEARLRLDTIIQREGPSTSKRSVGYLAGIAGNVAKELAQKKQQRLARERERREEQQRLAAEEHFRQRSLQNEEQHPEQAAEAFMRAHQASLETSGHYGLSTCIRKIREAVGKLFEQRPALARLDVDALIELARELPGPEEGRQQLVDLLERSIADHAPAHAIA